MGGEQGMTYEASLPPRYNISPEMFMGIMSGHPVTHGEIQQDSADVVGVAPITMPTTTVPSTVEEGVATAGKAVEAVTKKSKKEKTSKKAKVSGKKKGCC